MLSKSLAPGELPVTLLSSLLHLPQAPTDTPSAPKHARKGLRLADLHPGQSARITRVGILDDSCRKRLAELGIAEGSRITVAGNSSGQIILQLGGAKMALGAGCAAQISVSQIHAPQSLIAK